MQNIKVEWGSDYLSGCGWRPKINSFIDVDKFLFQQQTQISYYKFLNSV